jgi:threonine synthase
MYVEYDIDRVADVEFGRLEGPGIWPYAELLPIENPDHFVSLGEGSTPLIATPRLAREVGLDHLFVKFEGSNPTGTVKDRSTATAVAAALQFGFDRIGVVSTGNAGSSLGSYAARAGIRAFVFAAATCAKPKVSHMAATTSDFYLYEGNYDGMIGGFDQVIDERIVFDAGATRNAYKQDGKKTIAYEIFEQMGLQIPDFVVYPIGIGEALLAGQRAFAELNAAGHSDSVPRPVCAQSAEADTVIRALDSGGSLVAKKTGYTVAEGVAVGDLGPKGEWVLKVTRENDGLGAASDDREILEWQAKLAHLEGIWAGPTGCVTLPALAKLVKAKAIPPDASVVCIVSETGLKSDAEPPPMTPLAPTSGNIRRILSS